MKTLIIGVNTRHIACSASRTGHTVYALDSFGDIDLDTCCRKLLVWDNPDIYALDLTLIKPEIVPLIRSILPVDTVVLGPGFEQESPWIREIIGSRVRILNNPLDIIAMVSDKIELSKKLKELNLPHPYTVPLDSVTIPDDWTSGYPAIIKPRCGAGGMNNMLIKNDDDLSASLNLIGNNRDQYLLQVYISGTISSVSVISTTNDCVVIAVNEHLAGIPWLTGIPFAYCGNITPYLDKYTDWMCKTAVDMALHFKLIGSIGIDYIITENGPIVLEINPRFQGSMDTIEMSTGINIFQAHYDAFNGILPEITNHNRYYNKYSIRTIYFSPQRIIINKEIYRYLLQYHKQDMAVDIPNKGTIHNKDEPLISFICSGNNRNEVIQKAKQLVHDLNSIINAINGRLMS